MAANESAAAPSEVTRSDGFRALHLPGDDALFTKLDALSPADGANVVSAWPGLTVHRFCGPARLPRVEFGSLSVGFLVRAGDTMVSIGGRHLKAHRAYVIPAAGADLDLQITDASRYRPVLYCRLRIDPGLIRSTSSRMYPFSVVGAPSDTYAGTVLSPLDDELTNTLVGFLGSLSSGCDRRVLAPLRLREIVYRLLQREQRTHLLQLANDQSAQKPLAAALNYIATHLADPLTVGALAAQVNLSPSAFSRAFREATGRPPYRYIKECRLDRARQLLDNGGLGVCAVAAAVGYSSVSHFIKEFTGRFGSTPGEYAEIAGQRRPALDTAVQWSSTGCP